MTARREIRGGGGGVQQRSFFRSREGSSSTDPRQVSQVCNSRLFISEQKQQDDAFDAVDKRSLW